MQRLIWIAISVAVLGLAGQASAAEVDMSKLTCKQVGDMQPARTVGVALWVNGYVHGKAGNPMVDSDKAQATAEKVVEYCKTKPESTLSSALEALAKM